MKDYWLKFGCFLTGHNYRIVKGSSEAATKRVKKYTSALLIICILWAFIGFAFADRYLKAGGLLSVMSSIVMILLVIQIERQIILSTGRSKAPAVFRVIIAIAMSLIGSVIIDQILFKEDIEQEKIFSIEEKVNEMLPSKSKELKRQIGEIDSTITEKERERRMLVSDIERTPFIKVYNTAIERTNGAKHDSLNTEKIIRTSTQIQNPKMAFLEPLDNQIKSLRTEKQSKDERLLGLRTQLEEDLKRNTGFLDELTVLMSIFSKSTVALFVWLIWIVFLLGLELFILVSKFSDTETDYDVMIRQQTNLHLKRIDLLSSKQ
jgi:hypothetical protein